MTTLNPSGVLSRNFTGQIDTVCAVDISGIVIESQLYGKIDPVLSNGVKSLMVTTLLGGIIAFGVVYNSLRIALSERNHELASLRVLGFERNEVAYILLGELGFLTLAAIPLGMLFGYGLCAYMAYAFDTDLYRIPLVLGMNVYAFAGLVVIVSFVISAIMIVRNLAHLDLVAVLKTKD